MLPTPEQREAFKSTVIAPTDFTIVLDHFQWSVHSNVLSEVSGFFKKACDGGFAESHNKRVTLHDDCPIILAGVLWWIYYGGGPALWSVVWDSVFEEEFRLVMGVSNPEEWEKLCTKHDQRPAWEKCVLTYQLAQKYDMADMAENMGAYLYCHLCDDAKVTEVVVKSMGAFSFEYDLDWREIVLHAMFQCSSDAALIYNQIGQFFDFDEGILDKVRDYMLERLKRTDEYNKKFILFNRNVVADVTYIKSRVRAEPVRMKLDKILEDVKELKDRWITDDM